MLFFWKADGKWPSRRKGEQTPPRPPTCASRQAALGVPAILFFWKADAKWPNPFKTSEKALPEKKVSGLQRLAAERGAKEA